jgi:hypothetical protein
MSDTAQSTVKDFEDDLTTTGTDDNHSPIRPEASTEASADDSGVTTLDNHSPILPKQKDGTASADEGQQDDDEGGVTTLDNHSPIAPPGGSN